MLLLSFGGIKEVCGHLATLNIVISINYHLEVHTTISIDCISHTYQQTQIDCSHIIEH